MLYMHVCMMVGLSLLSSMHMHVCMMVGLREHRVMLSQLTTRTMTVSVLPLRRRTERNSRGHERSMRRCTLSGSEPASCAVRTGTWWIEHVTRSSPTHIAPRPPKR